MRGRGSPTRSTPGSPPRHLSLHVRALVDGGYLAETRADRLGRCRGRTCIRSPFLDDVDTAELSAPVRDAAAASAAGDGPYSVVRPRGTPGATSARDLGPWLRDDPQSTVFQTTPAARSGGPRGNDPLPLRRHTYEGPSMTLAVPPTVPDPSVRSAIARLRQEFPELAPGPIVLVVRTCREELRGSPDGALPELVERLARQRLRVALD